MDGLITCVDMNVFPLGSHDVLSGMSWLEAHRAKLDCYNKNFEFLDEEGNLRLCERKSISDLWKEVFSNAAE